MAVDLTENRGPELLLVTGIFMGIAWISVLLRCYTRLRITNSFQADDWLMLCSIGIFTINAAFLIAGVHFGMGKHNAALGKADEIQALKYQALATIMYIADMAFIKMSIAVFLLRIAVRQRYKWIIKISMVIVVLWTIAIFLFNIFQCKPVPFQWDDTIKGGKCVSGNALVNASYAFSVLSVLSDWLYALIPIPMLWSVKMNIQTKISVTLILSLGIVASIATLIRVRFLIDLADFNDILFTTTDAEIWTIVEPGLSITAASVVTLRPLLRAMHITGFSSSDTYAAGYANRGALGSHVTPFANSRNAGGPGQGPYARSQELDDLPIHGTRTVIGGGTGFGDHSKAREVLGREDEISDIGSEDFIIHHGKGQSGIQKTNTVTVSSDAL